MIKFGFPKRVTLIEVGPRDGFQFESRIIPLNLKFEIVSRLIHAGLKEIQVASFVNPGKVPQMAEPEKLLAMLPQDAGVLFSGLTLNLKGVERAIQSGLTHIEISVSASDGHSRQNMGKSTETAMKSAKEMIRLALGSRMTIRGSIQCAFGWAEDPDIPVERIAAMASDFLSWGVQDISLSDTSGMAGPVDIMERLDEILPMAGNIPLSLHLHDTYGLGLVNVMTALPFGVNRFDVSFGGMGGCPFLKNAAGNIATEDTIGLMDTLNIQTGVDMISVAECSLMMEKFLEKRLPGKRYPLLMDRTADCKKKGTG
ncbi:MAG: hydroxymethylglutaryl-CoA lyase [Desulfatirhabdiaceae bacterium]